VHSFNHYVEILAFVFIKVRTSSALVRVHCKWFFKTLSLDRGQVYIFEIWVSLSSPKPSPSPISISTDGNVVTHRFSEKIFKVILLHCLNFNTIGGIQICTQL